MRKKFILAALVAAAVVAALFWTTGRRAGEIQVLATAKVTRGTVRSQLEATGIVKAQVGAIVKIGAQATGRLTSMRVKIGDSVREGDLIAQIDDREARTAQAEAQARLERERAELARARAVAPLSVAEAQADLEAAEAEAAYAADFAARQRTLFAQGLVARDTLDDAAQKAQVKDGALRARRAALERTRTETEKTLHKARKAVREAEAALESIQTRLSYTRIVSPLTGVVSQVTVQEGETVVAGLEVANLITVLDPTRLEMWIYVDETDIGQVRPGLPVEFQVDALPGTSFHGTIDQIYPEPEVRDNIVYYQALVRITPEQAQSLRPEMTTQCQIIVEVKDNVLALPNAALKWVAGEQAVYVMRAGKPERIMPELGLAGVSATEVLSGLAEGDEVAVQLVLPGTKAPQGAQAPRTPQAPPGPPRGRS
ncbi:efflux RND transporter periplasmic adaptor subunit [Desulfocurvus vexinensis]|uniref:efflux RND transporter periplasmic adaptor subunit n=1 Tax=Desulfocurvus vexinensis TaxID=399548 RepID=UPI00048B12CC|nr:efflux RND transporter periplasmic adaptor subunit [Desulfocurvus vexinensis]